MSTVTHAPATPVSNVATNADVTVASLSNVNQYSTPPLVYCTMHAADPQHQNAPTTQAQTWTQPITIYGLPSASCPGTIMVWAVDDDENQYTCLIPANQLLVPPNATTPCRIDIGVTGPNENSGWPSQIYFMVVVDFTPSTEDPKSPKS